MAPILEEILNELGGAVSIVKIDVDVPANMALARDYGVLSIPNMKLFRNGSFIREFMGRTPKALLRAELEWAVNG
ncbi:MAG: thioredoxin 1 [Candidatus Parcubacteria bacterium]|jgi:thioredoxin 1|nr:thioredoxin 1 [Candidatus Parcubacteria bacterium]